MPKRNVLTEQQVDTLRQTTKTIPEFPAYSIDTNGHVYRLSATRKTSAGHLPPMKIEARITRDGHKRYLLTQYLPSRAVKRLVSAEFLLLTAFIGPQPSPNHEPCYRDGNPYHCWSSNVTWRLPAWHAE